MRRMARKMAGWSLAVERKLTTLRRSFSYALLAFCFAILLASSVARAESTISLLGVEAIDAPPDLASRLSEAIKNMVVHAPEFKLVSGKNLDEIKLVFGCMEEKPDCMARAGHSMQVAKLLWGTLKKAPRGFNFTLKLLDVAGAHIEKFVSENIDPADLEGAGLQTMVEKLTASFFAEKRGVIKIQCSLAGAQVTLGTQVIGLTEGEGFVIPDLLPGAVELQISKEGYSPWSNKVDVRGGQTTIVKVALAKISEKKKGVFPIPTLPAASPVKRGISGWKIALWSGAVATLGLAVGAIIAGKKVLDYQNDKEKLLSTKYQAYQNAFGSDICSERQGWPPSDLKSTCDKGSNWAMLTNVLIVTAGLGAVVTGAVFLPLYYHYERKRSIIADLGQGNTKNEGGSSPAKETIQRSWHFRPSADPHGGSLGLEVSF